MRGLETDTVAAIATPLGEAGLGVVRISGKDSVKILKQICKLKKTPLSHQANHGWAYIAKNVSSSSAKMFHVKHFAAEDKRETFLADEVVYIYYKTPKSYTGEDVVEIGCHGGISITQAIFDESIRYGARIAERGEFTKRAFLNGKMDITQAEAILGLIKAKNYTTLESAASQLKGALSQKINLKYEEIIKLIAQLEASIDFSDEIAMPKRKQVRRAVGLIKGEIDQLLETAEIGRILMQGIKTAIIGIPNVGKSSLLNAMAGEERAIVSRHPGTTRDVVQETINLGKLVLSVADTAGIGKTNCEIEIAGIERAKREINNAELIFFVTDASKNLSREERVMLNQIKEKKKLIVLNKTDLLKRGKSRQESILKKMKLPFVKTCLIDGKGIKELIEKVWRIFIGKGKKLEGEMILFNSRHKECLQRASEALIRAHRSIASKEPFDMIIIDLRGAAEAIGEITGRALTENVLDKIFNEFCVGK